MAASMTQRYRRLPTVPLSVEVVAISLPGKAVTVCRFTAAPASATASQLVNGPAARWGRYV
ncbi:hypothetical protein, partial [Mycolicibacterium sp. 120270]|uniref:hypothetical protein n=1 Tax=Mycolicibacterium sp. 120270 TaxID=3090600 RepID=UPI00299E39F9